MLTASESVSDLGLMGGMFDPVHNGHLNIALSALKLLQLDRLALLPCGNPVHRENRMAPAEHRLAMLALAIKAYPGLAVDDRECRANSPSFALDSLKALRIEYPQTRLYYLMGQDAFNRFHTWHGWRDILQFAHVVIAGRPGFVPELTEELQHEFAEKAVTAAELKAAPFGKFCSVEMELMDISSSQVREMLSRGENIDDLVPAEVARYIHANRLYTPEKKS